MVFSEIKKAVIAEYDRRKLSATVRYKALDDFEYMLNALHPELIEDVSKFPRQKEILKNKYEKYRTDQGKKMSSGASSMINEVYNQLQIAGAFLPDYKQK